ncbi:MAG TPA: hypothetical protein VN963_04590 [bacterium]|nr:hypothetical protein [bacterium]
MTYLLRFPIQDVLKKTAILLAYFGIIGLFIYIAYLALSACRF